MSAPAPAPEGITGAAADALRRLALDEGAKAAVLADPGLRAVARRVAARYIAGETLADAHPVIAAANARGHAATVDYMGESIRDLAGAREAADVFGRTAALIARERLDCSLSLDLSHLGLLVDRDVCVRAVSSLATAAGNFGSEVIISAEGSDRTGAILDCHARLCERHDNVGIRLQARLHRSERDLETLLARPGRICLLKGSYLESPEVAMARDDPALAGVFAGFADALVASGHRCSIATHDADLQERAIAALRAHGRLAAASPAERTVEFETLQGLGDTGLDALRDAGLATRLYVVFGEQWFLYVLNRIAEEPAGRIPQAVVDASAR
ncbi:MAG TPA: proline dehydrogenase family protein [Gaiellales bacterium]